MGSTSRIGATRKEYLKNSLRGEFEKSTEIESNSTAVQQPASRLNSNSQSWNSGIDVSNIRNSLLSTTNLSAVERNDTLHLTTRSWNGKSMGRKTIFFTPFWNIFFPPPFISIFLFFFFCFLFFFSLPKSVQRYDSRWILLTVMNIPVMCNGSTSTDNWVVKWKR